MGNSRRTFYSGLMIAFSLLLLGQAAPAQTVVVPNAYQNAPAEYQVAGGGDLRVQQIYSSTQFWPANETHQITSVAFRPGGALFTGTYTWTMSNVEVYLFTTSRAAGGLSEIFADNYLGAADRTLVYSGPLTVSFNLTSYGGPHSFGFVIPFQIPFNYTPGNGNLVVDLINHDAAHNLFEAQMELVATSNLISYVAGGAPFPNGRTSYFQGAGLVTQFETDYVASATVPTAVTILPAAVTGGATATGTVTLSAPAPAGGVNVVMSSDSANAIVPASILIAGGATSGSFTITTNPVASTTTATITAALGGNSVNGTLTVNPPVQVPVLTGVTISPSSVTGGTTANGIVTLSAPAPSGGLSVMLSSNNPAAAVPASVLIAGGAISGNFKVTTTSVTTTTTATITVALGGNAVSSTLTVNPPASSSSISVKEFEIEPGIVRATDAVIGQINLSAYAPAGGVTVQFTSSNPAALKPPATVYIPSGTKEAKFKLTRGSVSQSTTVQVTAILGNSRKTVSVTVLP